jgi:hypothetical protein
LNTPLIWLDNGISTRSARKLENASTEIPQTERFQARGKFPKKVTKKVTSTGMQVQRNELKVAVIVPQNFSTSGLFFKQSAPPQSMMTASN